ncbi:uncharacterized protein SPPG_01998 [Spizellomyces punctatus DAOM BR117]|uniref:Uncharacterized protein n=1 Tax=Spizellomyces punctatus (strain DAOM BR117) TaxID=645134 RepID=A0A0L0HP96_SPIPD|nr:uncharacterized protein SPPG_01998 [Spizellomyces punctatus DAOM BR117]KND02917.1 hypothetical protein SPPG_01998 [Spizellomyces punctatus DAOM BR117]|eukprot:XP_016610956.1 hypothetical protein SPPG_01998 [Spizellomyces punctatus DAOM BR117]
MSSSSLPIAVPPTVAGTAPGISQSTSTNSADPTSASSTLPSSNASVPRAPCPPSVQREWSDIDTDDGCHDPLEAHLMVTAEKHWGTTQKYKTEEEAYGRK